jgi:hypothetical protein
MEPIFPNLNHEQADGLACIVCNADFTTTGIRAVPVGRAGSTGSQVFGCEPLCAPAVGYRPDDSEQMELQS